MEEEQAFELIIGTYTGQGSEGLYRALFHEETGTLSDLRLLAESPNPSFVAVSQDRETVYCVNETEPGALSIFSWNEDRTRLMLLQTVESAGDHPCFLELNQSESLMAIANYSSATVAIFPLGAGSTSMDLPQVFQQTGSGPHLPNQHSAHAHCATFGPSGNHIYAADLGADKVYRYSVEHQGGEIKQEVALDLMPGDGPRHLAFHPELPIVFIINELSSTVVSARISEESGALVEIGRISTLPADFVGKNYCADVQVSSDGRFLYASNRGHNSIAVCAIGEEGTLTLLQTESVQGDWPRHVTLSPSEQYLLVANQLSDNITVLGRDADSGMLHNTGQEMLLSQPVCLRF